MKTNLELLKDAYAIIDGIPESHIDLKMLFRVLDKNLLNVIAHPLGWLCLHPTFAGAYKFRIVHLESPTLYSDIEGFITDISRCIETVWAPMFSLSPEDANNLFTSRDMSTYDWGILSKGNLGDKQLFLARVRTYLSEQPGAL